jgi:hypothetical protein
LIAARGKCIMRFINSWVLSICSLLIITLFSRFWRQTAQWVGF